MNWEKLNEFPPPLVRCLARVKARGRAVRALTDQEVALGSSGLTTLQVREIAMTSDWEVYQLVRLRCFVMVADLTHSRVQIGIVQGHI